MKLDLGIARIEVPNDDLLLPTALVGVGREDKQEQLSVGPTMAKATAHSFRRTLSINFTPVKKDAPPEKTMELYLNSLVTKFNAKVRSSQDRKVMDAPAKVAELSYTGPNGVPLVTFMLTITRENYLQIFIITGLDDKKILKELRAQFESIINTIEPGSYFE